MEMKGKQLCDSEEADKPPFNFQVTKKLDIPCKYRTVKNLHNNSPQQVQ